MTLQLRSSVHSPRRWQGCVVTNSKQLRPTNWLAFRQQPWQCPCRAAPGPSGSSSSDPQSHSSPDNAQPADASKPTPPAAQPPAAAKPAPWQQFLVANCLPLALVTALTVGMLQPQLGAAAARTQLQTCAVIMVFLLSGLQLKQGEVGQALRSTGKYGPALKLLLHPLPLLPWLVPGTACTQSNALHPPVACSSSASSHSPAIHPACDSGLLALTLRRHRCVWPGFHPVT